MSKRDFNKVDLQKASSLFEKALVQLNPLIAFQIG